MANHIIIRNIFYMLAYVYDSLKAFHFEKMGDEAFEDVYTLLSRLFLEKYQGQLASGLKHDYVNYMETTAYPHRQLLLNESIAEGRLVNQQVVVADDEFSVNIPVNQVLKYALKVMAQEPTTPYLEKAEAHKRLLDLFNVADLNFHSYQRVKQRLNYLQENTALVILAELMIEGRLFSDKLPGESTGQKFIDLTLHSIYEQFLRRYYQLKYSNYLVKAREIQWASTKNKAHLPKMFADIKIQGLRKTVILDAKFYGKTLQGQYDVKKLHSENMYQILAYVLNEAVTGPISDVEGIMLYAKTIESDLPNDELNILGHHFQFKTLDLNVPWPQVKQQLNNLVQID